MCTYRQVWHARSHGGKEKNFSALTLSLMVAGDVSPWRGKVDCSIASWTEWHCLHSLSLSTSLLFLLLQYPLAPPPFLCTLAGSTNCTAQQSSPTAAADPAWALRIWVGWDVLKGNATSRVSVCVCVYVCAHILNNHPPQHSWESSVWRAPCGRDPLHAHITLQLFLFIFTPQQKLLWDMIVLTPLWGTACSTLWCDLKLVKMSLKCHLKTAWMDLSVEGVFKTG